MVGRVVARQGSIDDYDPHEQIVRRRQPASLHLGVGQLGCKEAVDKVGSAGAQVALAGTAAIPIGLDPDPPVLTGVNADVR
jgi:hypothetical protein